MPPVPPRSPYSYRSSSYGFGPGRITPAVKALIIANVVIFLLEAVYPPLITYFGLMPVAVFENFRIWQVVTYLFLHADPFHLILNMLTLWMFGVELERTWGTQAFVRYYFVCGIGAGLTSLLVSWLPFDFATTVYLSNTVGASGAIYGLLLAYGMIFKDRPIYMYFLFPIPAKWFVIITGALVLWASVTDITGGVSHVAHLGGMAFGYFYLQRGRGGPWAEIKYRYTKWRLNRLRRKFDVHPGGRRTPDRWVH
jgi:membrane associated rhomboid family serine protease